MIILGIETSCDDTGIAILKVDNKNNVKILSNVVSSQTKVHQKYGGIVPNLAAREHLKNIKPCLKLALAEAKMEPKKIDLMAVTVGPGLIPSLLVGVHFARTLAYVWDKPIIGVNHLEGHMAAALASPTRRIFNSSASSADRQFSISKQVFPAIALLVSGGHTQIILIKKLGQYKIIGGTRDDAAGECFDKIARLLHLGYPGGPAIAAEAEKLKIENCKLRITLPRPMLNQKNYDFSFSGLKTAVLYLTQKNKSKLKDKKFISEVCAEAQQAIVDVLVEKAIRAVKEYKVKTVILSGGVAANSKLREQLESKVQSEKGKIKFLVPTKNLCTDNAVMIALAGYLKYKFNKKNNLDWKKIKADANLRLKSW